MIQVTINGAEVLNEPYIRYWFKIGVFSFIYTFAIVLSSWLFNRSIFLAILAISFSGIFVGIFGLLFSIGSVIIDITKNRIEIRGANAIENKRDFKIEEYTRLTLKENLGTRIRRSFWYCYLYADKKNITLYRGDFETAQMIANSVAENLNIDLKIKPTTKITKKRVYMVSFRIFASGLILPPLFIFNVTDYSILFWISVYWGLAGLISWAFVVHYTYK